jgi:glycosyltransferase involved in cell wall biosynthesis
LQQNMSHVLVVRGHQATPWELRQWEALDERFDVSYLRTAANGWDTSSVTLDAVPVGSRRDRLPRGRLGDVAALLAGDRYTSGADDAYKSADIVHSEELAYWFAGDAARRKARHGYRLVQTVWETLPLGRTYRRGGLAGFRDEVLAATDLFLAATERARLALLLEGVDDGRIEVCPPGVDVERFAAASKRAAAGPPPTEHVIISPGRLVWEKGHHDALRALALLHRGIVTLPDGTISRPRLRIVGAGPEEARLRAAAVELGVADAVEIGTVPYPEMPDAFAQASCMLLGSQSSAGGALHPFAIPRVFWEEQFGMVFVEAMAAGIAIVATTNGAIPEVLDGNGTLVPAGDYVGMARALAAGPLAQAPGARVGYPAALVQRYSIAAVAERLSVAYDRVLGLGRD